MGSLRDKYLNKYTKKQEDEEKEKSPYVNPAQTKDDGTSVRSTLLNKYTSGGKKDEFTADSISTFFLDAEDYLSNAKARYAKIGVSTASDAWEKNRKESSNLLARGYSLRDYLSKNKDSLDEKSYKSMIKQLDSIDDALRGYTSAFRDARQYYSQWDSDEEYQKWKKEMEEYEALKNFDIQAGEKEIGDLEKALNEYKTTIRNATSESEMSRASEIFQKYGDANSINALIAEKKQYLNRAKHLQEGIALAGVINNDDFKDNSGYVSTKTDDRWSRLTSDFGMGYEDLTYEYINGEESGMRQEIINKAVSYDADTEKFFVYDHMTDDQISTYNYYYAKDGKEAAEKYLNSIQEALNYQAATERYEKMEGNTALELLFGIEAGVDQFQSGFKNVFNTEDDYIAQTATQMASGMVREDLADNGVKLPDWLGGASLGQVGYDAITTTMNMAPSIMTSTVLNIIAPGSGAVVGTAMMGASAAGNAYQEMLSLGYDKSQARAYSTLVGASEAGLQYLMGGISNLGGKLTGNALTKMMNGIDNAFLRTALRFAGNMASEGLEEGLQEILTPWFQNLIMHSGENVNWGEVAYSTLLGALTAGVMEGPNTISNAVSIRNTGKNLQNADISAQRLAEIGKTFSADTVAYQLAGRVDGNTGAYTMGRLFNEIGASLTEQNVTEITSALVAKGMDAATAQKNAKALAYVVEGGQLTDKQIAVIEGNEVLADVARSTLIDANTTWNQRTQGYNQALKALAEEMTSPKASRINPAQQSQENAPVSDTVDTRNKNGTESLSEAVDTSPAKVKTISSINNGQVTVNLEDGTEVNLKEADLSVDDGVRIDTIAKLDGISAADANFILNTLRTNTSTSAQMDSLGAREAYKYGYYGFSQEHMATHGVFANSLTDTQRQAIYQTGQNARAVQVAAQQAAVAKNTTTSNKVSNKGKVHFEGDRTSLTERQSASLTAMERVADALGVQIYVFESKLNERGKRVGANGWYDPKDSSIHIDLHAGENGAGTMLFTAAHELTHHVRKWSPEKFKTLSDFLMQEYGKKGVNADALVREQMAKAERNKRHLSYDEAFEEVVADSMEQMLSDGNVLKRLEKLKAQDKDLWHQIKNFIDKLAAKIREVYKGLTPDSTEANIVAEMGDTIYRLQELFTEGLVDATENFQSAMENVVEADAKVVSEKEIITDGAVVTDGEGKKYSIRSMKQDIAEGQMFEDLKTYCGWTQKQVNELRNNLADLVEYMTPYRNILDMNETYGREGRRFSPYKPNSDPLYKISMDFSTLCSKRLLTQYVIENLQLRENRPMSAEEQMAIRAMLNEYRKVEKGLQVACAMCYVEAARLKSPKQITKWMEDPGTQMKNYFADKNPEFANFIKEKQADFKESRGYDRNATKKDMSPKDVRELNQIRPRLRSKYQLSAEEAKVIERAKSLPGSTYLTAGNLASLSETDPTIYAAYTAFVRTATRSKSLETDEPYYYGDSRRDNGNGIIVSDSFIEAVNRENGMRFSSWSDWRIQHLLDYITAVIDNSVRGAAMHGYTKFGEEVRVLGKTGMMFNMSGVAGTQTGLNEDGSLSFSPTESIDVNEAIQLREEFPDTAGLQCIGVGDGHITALLRSDIIDYVIPYHVSGLNAGLRAMANIHGWKDYTSTQHSAIDKSIKFENAVDQEHWHEEPVYSEFFVGYDTGMTGIEAMRASADRYVQMCKDRGLKPKFEQFVKEDNYWKLLIDRKMVNQKTGKLIQQKPVTPTFDFDTVKSVVDQFVQNYDSGLEARALNHIVENWDSIPKRIRDLKKQGSTKAKKASKAVDTLANQTLAAQPVVEEIKRSDRDSDGNQISKEQQDFFKESKVRDDNGNLMVMYHGTANGGAFTVFDGDKLGNDTRATQVGQGFYFTNMKKEAEAYTKNVDIYGRSSAGKNPHLHQVYLNITNPFNIDSDTLDIDKVKSVYMDGTYDYFFSNWIPFYLKNKTLDGRTFTKAEVESMSKADKVSVYVDYLAQIGTKEVLSNMVRAFPYGKQSELLTSMKNNLGYDGIVEEFKPGQYQYVAFSPEQVKATDNQNPTSNPDIRYSDRDNAPTFYSHMAKVVDGVKQEKLGAASVVSMLRGKGVNAEEIKWSGIEEFLEGKKSVTKTELQEFIAGSMLQIEEETLDYKERPYTEDQKKRLDEYEAKRNEVVRRVADEWKRITGEEFPVQNPGYDLESTVSRKIIDTNLEHKRTSFEGRLLEKLRKDFQKVSENNDDFGFDSWRDALRSVYHDRKDFIKHYEMSANDKAVIVKLCNALNAQAELPPKISEEDSDRLRSIARETNPWDRKIMEVKHEYNEEAAKHMPKWGGRRYNLEGGKNYREVLFRIPDSTYTNDAMFTHWENRSGILAHARIQDFNTFLGKMLFVEELQSDWHNEGHKTGYKDVPDAPFRDNYHEFVLKRLIRTAAEQDYDSIGWTPAQIQVKRWSEKFAEGYRIEYDQDMPKFLNKYGKKWGTRVGKTVLDNGTEVWSMAITDSMKDSVLTEGQPLYSDRDTESVSNRSLLANAFESVAQNDIERQKLQDYKGKIDLINSEERKLSELNEKIKDLSFAKGPKDTKAIRDLQFQAKQTANRISTYDKQLLTLEASKPLQNVLQREKKMAYQRAEKKGKEALEAYREKTMKTQRELIEKWQDSRKKGVESRQKTAMRHKIKDVVNELNQYLLRGTKDRHVPIELQKAVAEALDAVNMDTVGADERIAKLEAEMLKAKTPEKIQEISRKIDHIREMGDRMNGRLKKLKDAYDQFVNSDDPMIAESHDEVISNKLQAVIESVGDTPLRDMNIAQLEDVYDMYRMVLTTIRNTNKAFKAKKSESISIIANQVMAEVEKVGGKKKQSLAMLNGVKNFGWNNLKPVYAFEHIGSDHFTEVFNNVRAGEDVWAVDVTEAREFYQEKSKKHGYDSWDFKKRYRFTSSSGMDFDLNLEQIMSLYAYSKREQAADHLKRGGIVIDESTKIIKKTKLGISLEFNPTEATAYNISDATLAEIISKLTADQKDFVDVMQDYLATVMGAKGNEVSLEMYGVKLFKEKFYFPLKSAQQFMAKAKEQQKGEVKIKNSGFSKETVQKASNPIVLTPFMNVWADHVNEMSMYHAFVLPMEDFYRVYNYKTPTSDTMATESVEMFIQNAYGKGATKYIDQLLKDLNGGARTDHTTGIINKMMGLFKKGAVFASLSVVVQQPSAIARAAALVDTKYFIGPKVDHKKHKVLWDEVKQYAPVAVIKEMGYFDTNMGKSTQDFILGKEYSGFSQKMKALFTDSGYRDEALSKAPALADEIAWCSIWEAVKRETKANYPGLDTKGEPFLKLAGSRFTEVIVKTQVYDSVLSRSGLMRSKDTGMKMATSFMAEPTTSINMIADALLKGKRGNRKYARGAIGAVVASQILNSILVSFVYAGRDDDEDETYAEKYIGTLTGEILDSLNPAGYIPFIKDIQSIVQGYDVERSDMAVISDLWKAWENLSKDYISPYRKVEGFAGSIAQIFGLPVKNIMRDARGIYQTIDSFVNGQQTTKAGIGYAVKGAITGKTVTNDQQLYEAILSGDQAQITRLKGRFEDQTAINNAIRKGLRENDSRIYEAALAQINGHPEERVKLQRQVIADGFSQDDVVIATNTIINNLSPSAGTFEPKKKGLYTTEDFALFVAGGNSSLASEAKKDIIATHQLNGKTADEAEKSFQSSAKTDLKEMLIAGTVTVAVAEHALKTYCGMDAGEAKTKVNEWNYFKATGVDYSDKREQFLADEMSASELVKALVSVEGKTEEEAAKTVVSYTRDAYEDGLYDRSKAADVMVTYGGLTDEEAEAKLRYIDVKQQFPDTFVDDAWVDEYYNEVESSGIPMEVFVDYRNQVKSITGKDKKEGRMAVINSMPISNAQKDALYFAEGWAASKLYEAPWR